MEPSATSTTVTGPVGERLYAGTEDTPVLDGPASLRHFHDSGARYKYPDLLTYLLDTLFLRVCVVKLTFAGGGEHSGGDRRRQGV